MVESGGKVKCAGRETQRHSEQSEIYWVNNPPPLRSRRAILMSETALFSRDDADRWWLVEAESADAARQLIKATTDHVGRPLDKSTMTLMAAPNGHLHEGRVLASGERTGGER